MFVYFNFFSLACNLLDVSMRYSSKPNRGRNLNQREPMVLHKQMKHKILDLLQITGDEALKIRIPSTV
jgi:hypothetical protein